MITVAEYKKKLTTLNSNELDNLVTSKKKLEQKRYYIERYYNDYFLNKIINDTYDFIKQIICDLKTDYYKIKLGRDITPNIPLELIGPYFCDRLYVDTNNRIISALILKHVFGKNFIVAHNIDENEEYDFDYNGFLYLQGFPKDMSKIKMKLFGIKKIRK